MSRKINLADIFNYKELVLAAACRTPKEICTNIVEPVIDRVNQITGQENNPMFWAYILEHQMTIEELIVIEIPDQED